MDFCNKIYNPNVWLLSFYGIKHTIIYHQSKQNIKNQQQQKTTSWIYDLSFGDYSVKN